MITRFPRRLPLSVGVHDGETSRKTRRDHLREKVSPFGVRHGSVRRSEPKEESHLEVIRTPGTRLKRSRPPPTTIELPTGFRGSPRLPHQQFQHDDRQRAQCRGSWDQSSAIRQPVRAQSLQHHLTLGLPSASVRSGFRARAHPGRIDASSRRPSSRRLRAGGSPATAAV